MFKHLFYSQTSLSKEKKKWHFKKLLVTSSCKERLCTAYCLEENTNTWLLVIHTVKIAPTSCSVWSNQLPAGPNLAELCRKELQKRHHTGGRVKTTQVLSRCTWHSPLKLWQQAFHAYLPSACPRYCYTTPASHHKITVLWDVGWHPDTHGSCMGSWEDYGRDFYPQPSYPRLLWVCWHTGLPPDSMQCPIALSRVALVKRWRQLPQSFCKSNIEPHLNCSDPVLRGGGHLPRYHLCCLICFVSNIKLFSSPHVCDPPGNPGVASHAPPVTAPLGNSLPALAGPASCRGLGLDDLQLFLPTSVMLLFWYQHQSSNSTHRHCGGC